MSIRPDLNIITHRSVPTRQEGGQRRSPGSQVSANTRQSVKDAIWMDNEESMVESESTPSPSHSGNDFDRDEQSIPSSELKADEPHARAESSSSETRDDASLASLPGRLTGALTSIQNRTGRIVHTIRESGPDLLRFMGHAGAIQGISSTLSFGVMTAILTEVSFGLEAVGVSPQFALALAAVPAGFYIGDGRHTKVGAFTDYIYNRFQTIRKGTPKTTLDESGRQKAQLIRTVSNILAFTALAGTRAFLAEGHFDNTFGGIQNQLLTKEATIFVAGFCSGAIAEGLRAANSELFDFKILPAGHKELYQEYLKASAFPTGNQRKIGQEWTGKDVGIFVGLLANVFFQSPDFTSRTSEIGHGFVDGAVSTFGLLGGWFLGQHYCAWRAAPHPEATIADISKFNDWAKANTSSHPADMDRAFAMFLRDGFMNRNYDKAGEPGKAFTLEKPMSISKFHATFMDLLKAAKYGKNEDPEPNDVAVLADKLRQTGVPDDQADYMAEVMLAMPRSPGEDEEPSVPSELNDVLVDIPVSTPATMSVSPAKIFKSVTDRMSPQEKRDVEFCRKALHLANPAISGEIRERNTAALDRESLSVSQELRSAYITQDYGDLYNTANGILIRNGSTNDFKDFLGFLPPEIQSDDVVIDMSPARAPSRAAPTAAPALTPAQAFDLFRTPMTDLLARSGLESMPRQNEMDELAALCVAYGASEHDLEDVNGVISSFGGRYPNIFRATNSADLRAKGEKLLASLDFGLMEPDFTEFARNYLAAAVDYKNSKVG